VFNVLAGSDRAIVTEVPGTTRDLVTEDVDVDGLALTLVDTAGWRETLDLVEREGVARGARARAVANVILLVLDQSEPLTADDERLLEETATRARIVVVNKSDHPAAWPESPVVGAGCSRLVNVSAKTRAGFDDLRQAIVRELTGDEALRDTAAISNTRHTALLDEARASLASAQQAAGTGATPEEFVLIDLQAARARFDEIVGARTSEDLLRHIFERFCIGK
jgi:tRNA modification GTPase